MQDLVKPCCPTCSPLGKWQAVVATNECVTRNAGMLWISMCSQGLSWCYITNALRNKIRNDSVVKVETVISKWWWDVWRIFPEESPIRITVGQNVVHQSLPCSRKSLITFSLLKNLMVHISFLPPALSWTVTSLWSPRFVASSLPSGIQCFPILTQIEWIEVRQLMSKNWRLPRVHIPQCCPSINHSLYCLMNTKQPNPPLIFPGRVELIRKPRLRAIWLAYKITANELDSQLAM